MGWGQGRAWPLLAGERAHYELAAGSDSSALHQGDGAVQLDRRHAAGADMGLRRYSAGGDVSAGESAGSAQPLVWAHSEYMKLLRSAADGQVFDCISVVEERYAVATGEADVHEPYRDLPDQPAGVEDLSGRDAADRGSRSSFGWFTRWITGRRRTRRIAVRWGMRGRLWISSTAPEQTGNDCCLRLALARARWQGTLVGATILMCPLFFRRHATNK